MPDPRIISLDIETYGAAQCTSDGRRLPEQTVFHPRRSLATDGVGSGDLILTCAITVPDSDPRPEPAAQWSGEHIAQLQPGPTMVFSMWLPSHRQRLRRWLSHTDTIIGTNLGFDIAYLRALPEFRPFLTPTSHHLIDLMVLNYLHDETRPERSLKTLGPILRTHRYETTLKHSRFPSASSPELAQYNAEDTHNTLLACAELARRTINDFGAPSYD